jgi:hypothetical protein
MAAHCAGWMTNQGLGAGMAVQLCWLDYWSGLRCRRGCSGVGCRHGCKVVGCRHNLSFCWLGGWMAGQWLGVRGRHN